MRGWKCLLVILAAAVAGVTPDQQAFQQHAVSDPSPAQKTPEKAGSTGNLIFWSINSLLQFWPNTRYINGMMTF